MVDGDISLFDHVDALPALGGLVGGDLGGPLLGHADNPLPDSWLLVLFTEGESDQPVDQLVESPYVHHDSRNENDHDAGVSHQLMPRRTNDLAELVEDLTDKQGDRLEEPDDRPEESTHRVAPLGGITACATGARGACRTRHAHSSSSLTLSGGVSRATAREPPLRTSLSDQTLRRNLLRRAGGTRTPNRRFWRPMLYQLSHCPMCRGHAQPPSG